MEVDTKNAMHMHDHDKYLGKYIERFWIVAMPLAFKREIDDLLQQTSVRKQTSVRNHH